MATVQLLVRQLSEWAYGGQGTPVWRWRHKRMKAFLEHVKPPPKARIIDLGGDRRVWDTFEHQFDVTLVNVPRPGVAPFEENKMRLVIADACELGSLFEDRSFDVVFSNSVIEHVGDASRRRAFAREATRLGRGYWVQTPSERFPIEAHTGVPFYFALPDPLRAAMHRQWERELPEWYEMIRQTTVVTRAEMSALFPRAEAFTERLLGFEKSYSFYRPYLLEGHRSPPWPQGLEATVG